MNKKSSIIRISILFILSSFAMLFICGEEMDENLFAWTVHFFIDKALGISTCFVVAKLYKRWSKIDPWIMACYKLCDDIMDNPNPNKL